ncbi:MAG: hypothetical protein NZ992_00720 [Candidatus Korarchaeum sp.]|nr:hypothetical protein [Candidatus Korarchaeum sp.]MDW8035519.1 hypothetical protein [Candidatus Korarchaeum sp.]
MPRGLEIITGRVTAPGTTLTALTANTGDSFVIKNAVAGTRVFIVDAMARIHSGVYGVFRLRSPKMHDNVQGLNWYLKPGHNWHLLPTKNAQPVYPQDVIVAELSGSGTSGHIEHGAILVYYDDLPGVSARLVNYSDIAAKIKNYFTVRVPLSAGTSGDYTGTAAINVAFDLFKANVDYALLGYKVDRTAFMIGLRGPDTGNLRIGFPAIPDNEYITAEYFIFLNERFNLPTIPVINGSNKFSTTLDVVQDETGGTVNVTLLMAELG